MSFVSSIESLLPSSVSTSYFNNSNSIVSGFAITPLTSDETKQILIYTDGSCVTNPISALRPSGYSYIIKYYSAISKEIDNPIFPKLYVYTEIVDSKGFRESTSNRMELMGAWAALAKVIEIKLNPSDPKPTLNQIIIFSDSKYVVDGINIWMATWKTSNWLTSKSKDVINKDLWMKISDTIDILNKNDVSVLCIHVNGHKGIIENERCDRLAKQAATTSATLVDEVYESEVSKK